ncbi:hypothetical protein, partial [Pseudomonas syringae]|uniref:hypothetical protein n=1 Tax=Pseudomonas syringae TaxID=317 RepID=UPI0011AEF3C5
MAGQVQARWQHIQDRTQSVQNRVPTLEWCDPRRLDATFGGVMGKYTEQAKLAAVKEYCAGKAGLRDVAH